jgi:hypothetical protein
MPVKPALLGGCYTEPVQLDKVRKPTTPYIVKCHELANVTCGKEHHAFKVVHNLGSDKPEDAEFGARTAAFLPTLKGSRPGYANKMDTENALGSGECISMS